MKRLLALALILTALGAWCWRQFLRPVTLPSSPRTVTQVLRALGPKVDAQLAPLFRTAGVAYPPAALTMVAFKAEKRLDVFASNQLDDDKVSNAPRLIFPAPSLPPAAAPVPNYRKAISKCPKGFIASNSSIPIAATIFRSESTIPTTTIFIRARKMVVPLKP